MKLKLTPQTFTPRSPLFGALFFISENILFFRHSFMRLTGREHFFTFTHYTTPWLNAFGSAALAFPAQE